MHLYLFLVNGKLKANSIYHLFIYQAISQTSLGKEHIIEYLENEWINSGIDTIAIA